MIGYGKTFVGMSLNGIKTVLRLGIKVLAKVFGFGVFRKMLDWLNKQKDFEGLEGVWGSGRTVEGKFGKMVLFLRIASLIGKERGGRNQGEGKGGEREEGGRGPESFFCFVHFKRKSN